MTKHEELSQYAQELWSEADHMDTRKDIYSRKERLAAKQRAERATCEALSAWHSECVAKAG